jgi:hypothetical protein
MNTFDGETDYSGFNGCNMAPSEDKNHQGPEQQRTLMVDSENSRHYTAGRKGDSALTAFLRSKKQNTTLSGTQHTNSTFDTFAQEDQEWGDDDVMADDESIDSIDVDNINNYLCPQPSYNVNDESIASVDINDIKNDMIHLSSYNEDTIDEALKWTEGFTMDHHEDDYDEESSMDEELHDSSFNKAFEKLTSCMERSALTRQLVRQYSEKALRSSTSALDISKRSFNHQDSLRLLDPLGHTSLDPALGHSSSNNIGHSSIHSITSGLAKTRIIKKAQNITRSGLIRRHSHRSLSGGQDIAKSLNCSLNSISLHGNSSLANLPRTSSVRNTKLSQDTSSSLMESPSKLSLRVLKARLSQNVDNRRILDYQHSVSAAPKLKAKPTSNDMVQRYSRSMPAGVVPDFVES